MSLEAMAPYRTVPIDTLRPGSSYAEARAQRSRVVTAVKVVPLPETYDGDLVVISWERPANALSLSEHGATTYLRSCSVLVRHE